MEATIQYIKKELAGLYPATEVTGFIKLIFEHVCQMTYTDQVIHRKEKLNSSYIQQIEEIVSRLKQHEPIQYILGETEFLGLKIKVNPSVLIPRPETEELVNWIIKSVPSHPVSILDIGTGSGCIALTLKHTFKNTQILAIEHSADAISTARINAQINHLDVHFIHTDIFKWKNKAWEDMDIIVSNPPYIRETEKKSMLPNVLKYEPKKALFVSNTDPLIFYREIARFAKKTLKKNGWLYVEINENFGDAMASLLNKTGFKNVEIKKDLYGKDRMLRCRK